MDACSCKLIRLMGQAVQGKCLSGQKLRQWKFQLSEMGLKTIQYNS